MDEANLTYDIAMKKGKYKDVMGWSLDKDICVKSVDEMIESNCPHLCEYLGGTISVYCIETGETVYSKRIPR